MLENARAQHRHDAYCGCGEAAMAYTRAEPGPITVFTQPFDSVIAKAIDGVEAARLPDVRFTSTLDLLRGRLKPELARCGFGPVWLADWLVENVHFQGRLFSELTQARELAVKLERVEDDGCPRFHIDNMSYRLLCTYRGPGTEWLDPKAVADGLDENAVPAAAIRQVERGAIALLRGGKGATPVRPGLAHRSPRIEGTGLIRLLLVIDDADG